jgi:hypothetical protein
MRSLIGFVSTIALFGGLVWVGNKGFGYKKLIDQLTINFKDITDFKFNLTSDMKFTLRLIADNPTWQPLNVDALFLDIKIIDNGKEIKIADIREENFNQLIESRGKTVLPIKVNVSFLKASQLLVDNIFGFFTSNFNLEEKQIAIIGDVVVEGVRIPVDETMNATEREAA